jgi:hypothetical protein
VIDILKDANPIVVLVVLLVVLLLAGWMFRRLVTANDRALREIVSDLRTVKDKVGILETTDATRQRSMSDGANKFALLAAADQLQQDRYLALVEKLPEKYVDKDACGACASRTERALTAVSAGMAEVKQALAESGRRIEDRSDKIIGMLTKYVPAVDNPQGGAP